MANRYWLSMCSTIFVVVLGSFIRSAQTLECYSCNGESCNKLSKDTKTVNCTSLNANPDSKPANITDDKNGKIPITNDPQNDEIHTKPTTTTTVIDTMPSTTTSSYDTPTAITTETETPDLKPAKEEDGDSTMEYGEKRNAEEMYQCLKVITSDKNIIRRCALANNVTDACHTYTGLNASQATCYLCDKDKCNGAYVPRAAAAFVLISSLLLYFYLG